MKEYIQNCSAIEILKIIAKDREELIPEEIESQRNLYQKICREWLELHADEVKKSDSERYQKNIRARSEALIIAMIGKEYSSIWWNSPNIAFDMKTPEEMWQTDSDEVYKYILHHQDYTI